MINAEKAAYCTPTFAHKRERTLCLLLKDVELKCTSEVKEHYIDKTIDIERELYLMSTLNHYLEHTKWLLSV